MSTPATELVRVEKVSKRFTKSLDFAAKLANRFGAQNREITVHAVDQVDLSIRDGEVWRSWANPAAENQPWDAWSRAFMTPAPARCSGAGRM